MKKSFYYNFIIICSLSFLIVGCQLNDSLTKLADVVMPGNEKYKVKDSKKKELPKQYKKDTNQKKIKKVESPNFKDKVAKSKINKDEIDEIDEIKKIENFNEELALIQPELTKKSLTSKQSEIFALEPIEIGLLFPLSGKNSIIGETLINSIRLYLDEKESKINFRIYDTRSSIIGVEEAFKKALSENIKVFIGPIFSQETMAIKNIKRSKEVIVYSLSTDKNAISENIIITGFSLEDELSCIFQKVKKDEISKIGIIYNDDQYGNLLRKIISEKFSNVRNMNVSFLQINDLINLDNEIKKFSFYELGKERLKEQINKIKVSNIEKDLKEFQLKNFENLETFGDKPYELIIIGESGNKLIEILSLLSFYDINANNTMIYGTSIWEGLDRYKEDVIDNTFFATGLKLNKKKYRNTYASIFSSDPNNLNYIVNDLINFLSIQGLKVGSNDVTYDTKYDSDFSSAIISNEGYFKRKIFLNKYENGQIKEILSCPISII